MREIQRSGFRFFMETQNFISVFVPYLGCSKVKGSKEFEKNERFPRSGRVESRPDPNRGLVPRTSTAKQL